MMTDKRLEDEARLAGLLRLDLAEAREEPDFARLADHARICLGVRAAAICLLDGGRRRPIGLAGLALRPARRRGTVCDWVVRQDAPLAVEDLETDRRFEDHELRASGIRSYLGAPIRLEGHGPVGVVAALDPAPRGFTLHDSAVLESIAALTLDAMKRRAGGREDPSTGALSSDAWRRAAIRELARQARHGRAAAVALLEIDGFDQMRERIGDARGEAALRRVMRLVVDALRESDVCGRAGSGRIALLMPETLADDGLRVVERLRRAVADCADLTEIAEGAVTISAGVTGVNGAFGIEAALSRAGEALSAARRAGGDVVASHEPEPAPSPIRAQLRRPSAAA